MDFCFSRQRTAWIRILAVGLKMEGMLSLLSERKISSVGIIGLGAMGGAIAKQLLDRHVSVSAFRRSGMEEFIRDGGIACSSAEAVARSSRLLLLTLPDGDALASLFLD